MHVQLSLSLHVYLLYLLLNSCDRNDAFWRSSMLVKQSSSFSRNLPGNTGLYLSRSVSAKQSGWLPNLGTEERVYIVQTSVRDTSRCNQRLEAVSHWDMDKHITKPHRRSSWSMQKTITCKQAWGKITSLWTSAELKPALFRANTLFNRFFSEPPTVYRGKHVVSRHFRRSYLEANKVSKSVGTRKVKYVHVYHFWKCANPVDRILSKLVYACRSYSLTKLARFFETQCI